MTITLECKNFKAIPVGEGRLRLEIEEPVEQKPDREKVYEANAAIVRLGELLSRTVTRKNLAYWRNSLGLPHMKLGPKKFTYREEELVRWVRGRSTEIL